MIFDTDVIIWLLRGNFNAANLIEKTKDRATTVFTQLELFRGVKSQKELKIIKSLFYDFDFHIYPISENIGHRALIYIEAHGLSHGLGSMDSLIAASAVEQNEMLCTGNVKHFQCIPGLAMKVFKP